MDSTPSDRELASQTWPLVQRAQSDTLVVPVGATEQHGPHLPLATDSRIAEAVARAVVHKHNGAVLAPTVTIGASGEHAGFPGTLSVGTDALYTYLLELVRHSVPAWSRVLFVNGHGGNAPALARLAETCDFEKRPIVVHHCHVPGADAHAGRTETSLMLHLHPELVRLDIAEAGNTSPVADLLPAMRSGGVASVSPNGVLGDPTGASADEGRRLLASLVESAIATYRRT